MKRLITGTALAVVVCAAALSVAAQTNENTNAASNGMAYFRAPAALLPLLLVPLAGILYLLYEKISKRE